MTRTVNEIKADVIRVAKAARQEGLVVGSVGNFSCRDGGQVYITASGLSYEHQTPDDVVIIDLDGKHLSGRHSASSEHRVHLAIYQAREDVQAVVHTHSLYATAWSFLGVPLVLDSEEMAHFIGDCVEVADFAPTGTDELADHAVAALKRRQAVLLARHGPVSVGKSLEEALNHHLMVERMAHISWLIKSAGHLE